MDAKVKKVIGLSRQINEKGTKENTNNNTNDNTGVILSPSNPAVQIQATLNKSETDTNINSNLISDKTTETNLIDPREDQTSLDERSVFVKNIDEKLDVEELKQYFESCGAVERVTVLTNKFTGQPKGCAYVQFKSKVAVANALLLDGKTWQGNEIEVKPKRTNVPYWMLGRGSIRGRGFRGSFRARGRGFGYTGYRGGYRGRGYWHPYAGY